MCAPVSDSGAIDALEVCLETRRELTKMESVHQDSA